MKKNFIKIYGENQDCELKMKGTLPEKMNLAINSIYTIFNTFEQFFPGKGKDFRRDLIIGALILDGSDVEKFAESLAIRYREFKKHQEGGIKND